MKGRFSAHCSPIELALIGGSGIGLIVGMSKITSFYRYLLLVAIAIAPVPLVIYLQHN